MCFSLEFSPLLLPVLDFVSGTLGPPWIPLCRSQGCWSGSSRQSAWLDSSSKLRFSYEGKPLTSSLRSLHLQLLVSLGPLEAPVHACHSVDSPGFGHSLCAKCGTHLSSFLSGITLKFHKCACNPELLTRHTSKTSVFCTSPPPTQMRERLRQEDKM